MALVLGLPAGVAVVYRAFGAPEAHRVAQHLVRACRERGVLLLIGADARLAARVGAGGVHLPERGLWRARRLRQTHPSWVITGAAHSPRALRQAAAVGLDAVFVSTVFASRSASASARPLGPVRLGLIARRTKVKPHALGGVVSATLPRLRGTGVAGFGAVEAFIGQTDAAMTSPPT